MAASCLKTIADTEQVYDCADSTQDELNEFFESLTSSQFKLIQEFFETMPKLAYTLKVTNPNTGVESDVELEGLAKFFRIALLHNTLENYFQTNFALIHHHKWDIQYIEELMPWEKEVYIMMLTDFLREEQRRMQEKQNQRS